MKASHWALRFIVIVLFLNFLFDLLIPVHTKQPEPLTVIETKYITRTEYVGINQTEPMDMTVTAYTSGPESTGKRPGMKGYGVTFTGTKARPGVCAVDADYIPLNTSLYVESYGYCHVEDTGGKVKGFHVDVFMDKVSDALKFGNETRKVWILKDFGEGAA
jgi:3D (Asp-Asp-Asp) domain-containing protein